MQRKHQKNQNYQKLTEMFNTSSLFKQPFAKENIVCKLKRGKLFRLSKEEPLKQEKIIKKQQIDVFKDWLKERTQYNKTKNNEDEDIMKKSSQMGQTYFYLNTLDMLSIKQKQKNCNLPILNKIKIIKNQDINKNASNYEFKQSFFEQKNLKIKKPFSLTFHHDNVNKGILSETKNIKNKYPRLSYSFYNQKNVSLCKQHKLSCYQEKLRKISSIKDYKIYKYLNRPNRQKGYQQNIRFTPKNKFLRQFKKNQEKKSLYYQTMEDDLKRVKKINILTKSFFENLRMIKENIGVSCYDELKDLLKQFPNCQNLLNQKENINIAKQDNFQNFNKQKKLEKVEKKKSSIKQQSKCQTKTSEVPQFLLKSLNIQQKSPLKQTVKMENCKRTNINFSQLRN